MILCAVCGDLIEGDDLENRHGEELEEYHEDCCPVCN